MTAISSPGRLRVPTVLLICGLLVSVIAAALQAGSDRAPHNALSIVLGIAAFVAGYTMVSLGGGTGVSAAFIVVVLAAALLGPVSACLTAVIAELAASVPAATRPRPYMFAANLLGAMLPALAAAGVVSALAASGPSETIGFYAVVALAGVVEIALNFAIAAYYTNLLQPEKALKLSTLKALAPSLALSVILAVAGAAIYLELGIAGIAFSLTAVFAFSYMAHLVQQSRERAQQYVSLSWGVLAGLMRSLDLRDGRAARHAAAVARFSRDMATAVDMSPEERELAHTAGLLHDIGHFALSDRVAERGRTLTDEDWMAIQRHPELGADMLRDLGMYGPVSEIVITHHERIDGRGYPHGLTGDEIPELAKIISVAEVYDTLTASDTYRTRMSSFEALTELRRVAGSQVDARYVEVLANLMTGEGVEYRHADMADFDAELDMERRINQAGAGG
jgi:putative nucleotidyltransferase with HDIG domain